jgi:hypothetical protein
MFGFISTFDKLDDPMVKAAHSNYLKAFNPMQRLHETFRNLLFLKLFLDSQNIPFYFFTWDATRIDFNKRQFLSFGEALNKFAPSDLKEHIVSTPFFHDGGKYARLQMPFKQNIGRDGMHPGPNAHWNYSLSFYDNLRSREGFKKVLEKWK